jgi:hypothetical protein
MTLSTLFRPPAIYLVVAELVLAAILAVVAWHVWQDRVAPAGAALIAQAPPPLGPAAPRPARAGSGPATTVPAGPTPGAGPAPGIGTSPDFLARELGELNRVEPAFQDLEWRVTKAIIDGVQRYLEGVVLPSIDRSERSVR